MSACPAIEVLEEAAAGRVADTAVLDHLEACSHCQQQIAEIRENNALFDQSQAGTTTRRVAALDGELFQPDLIPGYEILAELARGGQGVVYQALQKSTKRKVAIKVLKEGPFADPRDRLRFEREAQILGQLNHPNIVAVLDSGAIHGCFYLVMRYISGQTLDAYLKAQWEAKSKRSTLADLLQLFAKICDAVNAAHLRGVIHRDLKPSNIRVNSTGEPHVLDFGLAKLADGHVTEDSHPRVMTRTGQFMGSLPWASPEQAGGMPDKVDLRTDVYSLGVILYQMLTEQFPYDVHGTMGNVLNNILRAEPARPSALRKQIDDEIETIVLKCLQKERERRYQSAGELARDLRHYLAGEPIAAKRDSLGYVLRKQLRKHRLPLLVAAALVGVVTIGFVTSLTFWRQAVTERNSARRAQQAESEQRAIAQANEQRAKEEAARAQQEALRAEREAETARRARDRAEKIAQFIEQMLAGVSPAVARGRDTTVLREMMDAAAQRIENGELRTVPEAEVHLRLRIGEMYLELAQGDAYDRAERMLRPALDLARASQQGDHPDVAAGLNSLAHLLRERGDLAAAEPLLREALEMHRRLVPGDHAAMATSLYNLAALLYDRGDLAAAEPLFHEALAMSRRLFPGDHPDVANRLNGVAALLYARGDLAAAEPLYREALEMQRRLFPGDHPQLAKGLGHLALLLKSRGDLAAAEPLYREALAMRRRLFPGDHPDVADNLDSLAGLLYARGDLEAAESLCYEALEMLRRLYPGTHPAVANSLNNLGFLLQTRGNSAAAEPLLREALEMHRRLFPGDHPAVLDSLNNLASVLSARHDFAAAEPLFREALAMSRKILPPKHARLGATADHLGRCLLDLQRFPEAEPLLLEAQAIYRRAKSVPEKQIVANRRALVKLYDAWHAAEPDKGHDAKAAEWRAKLDERRASTQPTSQPAAP